MNKEILFLVKSISDKELLSQEKIFEVLENALSISIKCKYSYFKDIRLFINKINGDFNVFRRWMVVSKVIQPDRQIAFKKAKIQKKKIKLNDFIQDQITSITLHHINTKEAKKIIFKKVQEEKQLIMLDEFYNQKGQIIIGTVKLIKNTYIILLVREFVEAVIYRSDMLSIRNIRIGDKVKGVLCAVYFMIDHIKLLLSQSNSRMLLALLNIEIPEVKEGLIKIKSIARDPGYRSKIAVESIDNGIDPVGACIGLRGNRIRSISNTLQGERIDIILWDNNLSKFAMNVIAPADIHDLVIHKNNHFIDIFVDSENISQLIGKNGQNVRLASQLLGWSLNIIIVDIMGEDQKSTYHFHNVFIKYFNFNRKIITSLIQFGLSSLKDLMYISYSDLLNIPGIDRKTAHFIKTTTNIFFSNNLKNKKYYNVIG
ncbi:transcription termination factor NusA [Buchnera aphidicola]|uniref:transcription termination factor NusA n=1 Tax=Buchnera aphidicola TaxID=9 RepID=UPI0034648329